MSISEKTIATPTTHYGKPSTATWRFIVQRATGLLNIFFTLYLIWVVLRTPTVRFARGPSRPMPER